MVKYLQQISYLAEASMGPKCLGLKLYISVLYVHYLGNLEYSN